MGKLISILEAIKNYQRPVRTVLWTILIGVAFILCLTGSIPCNDNNITYTILVCMFSDMGIYTVTRTLEKAKQVDKKEESV